MVKIRFGLIIFFTISILAWSPRTSLAATNDCIEKDTDATTCPPGNTYACYFSYGNGINSSVCCSSSTSCNAYKASLASNTAGLGSRNAWNPQGSCANGIDTALGCLPYKSENGELTKTILTFLAGLTGAISLGVMLTATIQIMTAGGNPEQVKNGKELLTGAITGLIFIIFSVTLLRLIAGDIIQLEGFV